MKGKLRLSKTERAWLAAYRRALTTAHAGALDQLFIYGSKASGEAGPESDLDVMLIVKPKGQPSNANCDGWATPWPPAPT